MPVFGFLTGSSKSFDNDYDLNAQKIVDILKRHFKPRDIDSIRFKTPLDTKDRSWESQNKQLVDFFKNLLQKISAKFYNKDQFKYFANTISDYIVTEVKKLKNSRTYHYAPLLRGSFSVRVITLQDILTMSLDEVAANTLRIAQASFTPENPGVTDPAVTYLQVAREQQLAEHAVARRQAIPASKPLSQQATASQAQPLEQQKEQPVFKPAVHAKTTPDLKRLLFDRMYAAFDERDMTRPLASKTLPAPEPVPSDDDLDSSSTLTSPSRSRTPSPGSR